MTEQELKAGDRIEALKISKEKQTIPPRTKGVVKLVHSAHKGLVWVTTDNPVRAMVYAGKKLKGKKEMVGSDFFVLAEEIKKI